jgi:hypothetical protein
MGTPRGAAWDRKIPPASQPHKSPNPLITLLGSEWEGSTGGEPLHSPLLLLFQQKCLSLHWCVHPRQPWGHKGFEILSRL